MKTTCCYCQKHISGNPGDKDISHGACPRCAIILMAHIHDQEIRIFDPVNPKNACIIRARNLDIANMAGDLRYQESIGRTEVEVV
jgi:hypothetical protein